MKHEVVFSDLSALANEKDRLSSAYDKSRWTVKDYETGTHCGQMLLTMESGNPAQVSFDLNLEGSYKIFLALPTMRTGNHLFVKLSDDLCFTGLAATGRTPMSWTTEEFLEEIYWKTADLTGRKLIIQKPDTIHSSISGLAWIRCVPAEEEMPAPRNKCMQMHTDEDISTEVRFENGDEYLMKLYQMRDSNADFVSYEISFDYDGVLDSGAEHLIHMDERWDKGHFEYKENHELIWRKAVAFAKQNGFGLYAANRMQVSNFVAPFSRDSWNMRFVEENPQFYCKTRLGATMRMCSYAYPEVQDYVIEQFVRAVKFGFDGVSLIFHRGTHIGFEQPVLDRFRALYPNIDPCRLPIADERLHGVWCEFMNVFMRRLRSALGDKIKINVITYYDLQTSKHVGLDVAYWAANGLIDSASQADMETVEELDGCMSEEDPGLIDLEKYRKELAQRIILRRHWGTNVDKVCAHIREYAQLKERYGIDVYHTLPWANAIEPEEYPAIVRRMQEAGAEKFLSWNTNHLMRVMPEWHVVKRIGNEPERETLRSFCRVLSFDGNDISHYHPNWRG